MNKRKKTTTAVIAALVIGIAVWGAAERLGNRRGEGIPEALASATVYKSPTCGCCGQYIAYLKREGYDVTIEDTFDMNGIKDRYGIPPAMRSCHTTVMDDYIVEGHIPVAAIDRVRADASPVDGIALPGMPAGSLGMPGAKEGAFTIYSLKDGQSRLYMNL